MYSVQFGYSEWHLLLFTLYLRTQTIKKIERAIIKILTQFKTNRSIEVSDKSFAFIIECKTFIQNLNGAGSPELNQDFHNGSFNYFDSLSFQVQIEK